MSDLQQHTQKEFGKEALSKWEQMKKTSGYKNHHKFTLRYMSKDVTPTQFKTKE